MKVKFIRWVYTDDDVGGSYPTGTILYENIDAKIVPIIFNHSNPLAVMEQQGLETRRHLSAMFWPGTLKIQETDEVEVTSPPGHLYYGARFRIQQLEYDGMHPDQNRGHLIATLIRSVIAHDNQFQ